MRGHESGDVLASVYNFLETVAVEDARARRAASKNLSLPTTERQGENHRRITENETG